MVQGAKLSGTGLRGDQGCERTWMRGARCAVRLIATLSGIIFFISSSNSQDLSLITSLHPNTIMQKQDLYNGIKWVNNYRNYENDQFLFTSRFLNGNVTVNSRTYNNIRLKYDIYSDEIITPVSTEDIIQINKEIVDSFSIQYVDRRYSFFNLKADSINNLSGYAQVLYDGSSKFILIHRKTFTPASDPTRHGAFVYSGIPYFLNGGRYYQFRLKSFYRIIAPEDLPNVKDYVRDLKRKDLKDDPEKIVPVMKYYDKLRKT